MLFFSHRHHHDLRLTPPLLFESVARYCIIMLGSENELYRENENKSNLAFPSMISQLTTLAAQTLEGSLLLYWKTSAHGTNGNLQKNSQSLHRPKSDPKVQNTSDWKICSSSAQQEGEDRGKWELPASSRWPLHFNQVSRNISRWKTKDVQRRHLRLPTRSGRATVWRAPTPPTLTSAPTQVGWILNKRTFFSLQVEPNWPPAPPDEVFSHIGIRESTPNDFVAL